MNKKSSKPPAQNQRQNQQNFMDFDREFGFDDDIPVISATTTTSTAVTSSNAPSKDVEITLKSSHTIPAFLTKLFNMVADNGSNNLIRWSDDGNSFLVTHQDDFAQHVLPLFFKHNNFSSFVRQLNMYGFHKVQHVLAGALNSTEPEHWEFTNAYFKRARPDLLPLVKRKSSNNNNKNAATAGAAGGKSTSVSTGPVPAVDMEGLASVVQELDSLKQTQTSIANDLQQIRVQNQLLWQESFSHRQKYEQQQAVIQKILGFLVSVVSSDKLKSLNANTASSSGPRSIGHGGNHKKRRLMIEGMGRFSSDEDDGASYEPGPEDMHQKIVELMNSSEDQSLNDMHSFPVAAQSSNILSTTMTPMLTQIPPDFDRTQLARTEKLSQDIDLLQDNIDNITDYLGISGKDFGTVSDTDVDMFLKDYLALESDPAIHPPDSGSGSPTPFDAESRSVAGAEDKHIFEDITSSQ